MRSLAIVLGGSALLALAGCGESDSGSADADGDSEVSVAEAADRVESAGIKPDPGQYRMTMEILEFTVPGAPAGMADMMRQEMGNQTSEYCLTPEDAERGYEEMARQSQQSDECTFSRFDVDGGNIDAEMTCNTPQQGTMTMTLQGEGTATASTMNMTMRGDFSGMGEMTMRARASHERIGDCT